MEWLLHENKEFRYCVANNFEGNVFFDKDDMVQKGYGWMLKAASEANQERVFDYVMSKKNVMPRTSLRYAIEKMPQELRPKAMAK